MSDLFIACLNRSMMGKRVCDTHRWSFLIDGGIDSATALSSAPLSWRISAQYVATKSGVRMRGVTGRESENAAVTEEEPHSVDGEEPLASTYSSLWAIIGIKF